ncbi:hypothetical protein Tco_0590338 [Tanacetum coccineum]
MDAHDARGICMHYVVELLRPPSPAYVPARSLIQRRMRRDHEEGTVCYPTLETDGDDDEEPPATRMMHEVWKLGR